MSKTTTIFAGVLVVALAAGGVALAADRSDDSVSTAATATATTYTVADAGAVTLSVEGSAIVVQRIQAATGWQAVIDSQTATELEVDFFGPDRRLRFNAELDGVIRTSLEDRSPAGNVADPTTTSTTSPTTPTTTLASTGSSVTVTTDDRVDDRGDDGSRGDDDVADDHGDDDTADDHGDDAAPLITLSSELGIRTVSVPSVGTVTVDVRADSVTFVSAAPAPGWSAALDDTSDGEVEVEFTNGSVEVDVKLEIEHGSLRLEVEQDD